MEIPKLEGKSYQETLEILKTAGLFPLARMQKKAYKLIKDALAGKELNEYQKFAIKTILHETKKQLDRHEGKPTEKVNLKQTGEMKVNINLEEEKDGTQSQMGT